MLKNILRTFYSTKYNLLNNTIKQLVILIAFIVLFVLLDTNACLVKNTIGIPCPGCGMTRAYLSLFHFDIIRALYFHPLFILPPFIMLIILFKRHKFIVSIYRSNVIWVIMTVIVVVVWGLRMILLFPDNPPMDFKGDSLLAKLISLFVKT